MLRKSQKAAFLSQKRNAKKARKARKARQDALRQRELGYRNGERSAQSILEILLAVPPEEREALGLRLRLPTAERLSGSLRYLSKGSPEYRAHKIVQETLREKKESGKGHAPLRPADLSASVPESLRSRNDPAKNKGPVTEVAEPLQFPASVITTAGRATVFTTQAKASSDENRKLS